MQNHITNFLSDIGYEIDAKDMNKTKEIETVEEQTEAKPE